MKPQREFVPSGGERPAQRPEQVFFQDPALDRVMGVLLALATEHYVLHDRVRALEERFFRETNMSAESLAAVPEEPDPAAQRDAQEFAESLLRPLLGLQLAAGAVGRFSLAGSHRRTQES